MNEPYDHLAAAKELLDTADKVITARGTIVTPELYVQMSQTEALIALVELIKREGLSVCIVGGLR
jgi:hypothetical protein